MIADKLINMDPIVINNFVPIPPVWGNFVPELFSIISSWLTAKLLNFVSASLSYPTLIVTGLSNLLYPSGAFISIS